MKRLSSRQTHAASRPNRLRAFLALLLGAALVFSGASSAQAATGEYTVELSAPATVPVIQDFAYNLTIAAPQATNASPATGIILTIQLPDGVAFDSVPTGENDIVSSSAYNAATRVLVLTMRDLIEPVSSLVFTVNQVNNLVKDSTTVFSTTVTGSPTSSGAIPSDATLTQVTGALPYYPNKTVETVVGGNNRNVTYYFNANTQDAANRPGKFTTWGQRFTDALPPGASVTGTFSTIGGTWSVTGDVATGQTVTWERTGVAYGPSIVAMDSVGNQLGFTVNYPESAFPAGTRPPANSVALDVRDYSGTWERKTSATVQGPGFIAGQDKLVSVSKIANTSTGADAYSYGNGQWLASYGVSASYLNSVDAENLGSMTVEDSSTQGAGNAAFFAQSDFNRLAAVFNNTFKQANVPYTLQYTTTAGPDWQSYAAPLSTSADLRIVLQTVGSQGFNENGYNQTINLPVGVKVTGWRLVFSPGATDAEVPTGSQVTVTGNYVPVMPAGGGSIASAVNSATVTGVLAGGSTLPVAADTATLRVADRVPIITNVLTAPTTLMVGSNANYVVNISNMDPQRDYSNAVMKVVLPVGVFYDPAVGISPTYATTPVTNVVVPTPGHGLTVSTESVTDAQGEHQVVVFRFDQLENLRDIGQPKIRDENAGFRYNVPVRVLPQAYNPSQPNTSIRSFAYTDDPAFQAVEMGWYITYYGPDVFDFNPALASIAVSTKTSTVATSGGLLIGKLVRAAAGEPWSTRATVATPGTAQWQIYASNVLADPVTDLMLFDRMPTVNDGRGSEFAVTLASAVTGNPPGSTVEYSIDATSAVTGTWTTNPVGATAFRVQIPTLGVGAHVTLDIASSQIPPGIAYAELASNVVDATATYRDVVRTFSSNSAEVVAEAHPSLALVKKNQWRAI